MLLIHRCITYFTISLCKSWGERERYNPDVSWITFSFEIQRRLGWVLVFLLREIWVIYSFPNHLRIWRINLIYQLFCLTTCCYCLTVLCPRWGLSAPFPLVPLKFSLTQAFMYSANFTEGCLVSIPLWDCFHIFLP